MIPRNQLKLMQRRCNEVLDMNRTPAKNGAQESVAVSLYYSRA
jgi:hypothetical protein